MGCRLEIIGTGSYLPLDIRTNEYFSGVVKCKHDAQGNKLEHRVLSPESIFQVTGIKERRYAGQNEHPSDMGYQASVRALEHSGIEADSIKGIIVASVSEKKNFPSAACKIQKKLGIRNCFAYDMQNACAGFPEAMIEADARACRNEGGNYLVIASEKLSAHTNLEDINSTLFGDGAGAAVLKWSESGKGIVANYSVSDPFDGNDELIFRNEGNYIWMPDGGTVMKLAVRNMLESARVLKERADWKGADVYIPHQANGRILDAVAKRVVDDGAIVYRNIEKYGNMSAATCAVALDEAIRDGTIHEGSRVIITSFGSGLVTSGVAVQF